MRIELIKMSLKMLNVCKHNLMQNKRTGSRREEHRRGQKKDFRHETKLRKKERQRRISMHQTGGGPATITLEQWEEKVNDFVFTTLRRESYIKTYLHLMSDLRILFLIHNQ